MSAIAPFGRVVDRTLSRGPVHASFRRFSSGRLAVLAYHGVDDEKRFAGQVDWLTQNANVVTLADVIDGASARRRLPKHPVLLTFDDAHRSVVDVALPLLRERGLPAVVFVVAGLVGSDQPFWWDEAEALWRSGGRVDGRQFSSAAELVTWLKGVPDDHRRRALAELHRTVAAPPPPFAHLRPAELLQLESAGIAVGNHSLTHPCLNRCADTRIAHEVAESHRLLTDWLGHPPRAFAYPNGDVDGRAVAAVARAGYDVAFLFDHRLTSVRVGNPLRMSRLRVDSSVSLPRFRTIVSGVHPALHRLRGGG